MESDKGKLFVISAPSGAGKGTIILRLLELAPELVFSVSATTRAPRDSEIEGVSYRFVTRECFLKMLENDEFLEHAEYVGEFYGTPKDAVLSNIDSGKDVLLDIEVQGARQVLKKMPEAVTIFIVPPNLIELERRLRGRGTDAEEKLAARMDRARHEMEEKHYYDHIVVNDYLPRAAEEILTIIRNSHINRKEL